ncbi:MAG: hypothetical protein NW226_01705 [Microscillaceae bacterium]|nr:hypothetical protein [Microscillaceae bacterium]
MQAIETKGTIDSKGILHIDHPLPFQESEVKVIILYPEDEFSDKSWVESISKNPAFDFLKEKEEEIYSLEDGKPFQAS